MRVVLFKMWLFPKETGQEQTKECVKRSEEHKGKQE